MDSYLAAILGFFIGSGTSSDLRTTIDTLFEESLFWGFVLILVFLVIIVAIIALAVVAIGAVLWGLGIGIKMTMDIIVELFGRGLFLKLGLIFIGVQSWCYLSGRFGFNEYIPIILAGIGIFSFIVWVCDRSYSARYFICFVIISIFVECILAYITGTYLDINLAEMSLKDERFLKEMLHVELIYAGRFIVLQFFYSIFRYLSSVGPRRFGRF